MNTTKKNEKLAASRVGSEEMFSVNEEKNHFSYNNAKKAKS